MLRIMTMDDYEEVFSLWNRIRGFGIRSIDDSYEGIARFLKRNPDTSIVAVEDEKIVGTILCGHDGRTGAFYHVCVDSDYRGRGIAEDMAEMAVELLRKEKINKISLIAFEENKAGNAFWQKMGWTLRTGCNQYELVLNEENVTTFNPR